MHGILEGFRDILLRKWPKCVTKMTKMCYQNDSYRKAKMCYQNDSKREYQNVLPKWLLSKRPKCVTKMTFTKMTKLCYQNDFRSDQIPNSPIESTQTEFSTARWNHLIRYTYKLHYYYNIMLYIMQLITWQKTCDLSCEISITNPLLHFVSFVN